jgi:hypothetical protein
VLPFAYVRIMGDPANTEQDSPLALAVAQFVFAEPGPGGQTMLNTRLGCDAKVRKVLASAAVGADRVRSLLFTYIPSPVVSGPPVKVKEVPDATSELHPFPSVVVHVPKGSAAGSLLKMTLLSDTVTLPVEPESNVLITLAEAFETKSKPPVRTATGAKYSRKFRKVIWNLFSDVSESCFILVFVPPKILSNVNPRGIELSSWDAMDSMPFSIAQNSPGASLPVSI